jgi:hypothetical protein
MRGRDGILIASDRREISTFETAKVATKSDVTKIRISPDGRFAWAYSGNDIAPIYSKRLLSFLDNARAASDEDAKKGLVACGLAAIQEWQQSASGPTAPIHPVIVMASAATKKIFRSIALPTTEPEEMMRGMCITGQTANWAAFFPERLYSPDMSVDELSWLAASSVRIAHGSCRARCLASELFGPVAGLEVLDHPHVAIELLPKDGQIPAVRRRNTPGVGTGFLLP